MLESYTNILEKKVSNLKKENKELQELLQDGGEHSCSFEQADKIMNKIFNIDNPKIDEPEVINISVATIKKNDTRDVSNDTKITLMEDKEESSNTNTNTNTNNDISDILSDILPIVKHSDEVEKDVEIESVISDNNIYNRKKLSKMNLDKIKEICASLNIPTEGTKNNLIDKILSQ